MGNIGAGDRTSVHANKSNNTAPVINAPITKPEGGKYYARTL